MAKKIEKTNVARLLDKAGIKYTLIPYEFDENDLAVQHVADCLGQPIERVFKTLVLHGEKTKHIVCVVPGNTEVNLKDIRKVMYIESSDARHGFKLEFESDDDAKALKRYSLATISLRGTVVRKEDGGFVISGLTKENVLLQSEGTEESFPRKYRSVSEVTSEDIFTYVTLADCEFVFKDGAYVNVHETYTIKTEKNLSCRPNGMMDGWGTLVCDKS